jgi:hypothetical protein
MELRQKTGVGVVSVTNIVTRLSPWGQTGAIPSRLARSPASRLIGIDRMSTAQQRLAKRRKPDWEPCALLPNARSMEEWSSV